MWFWVGILLFFFWQTKEHGIFSVSISAPPLWARNIVLRTGMGWSWVWRGNPWTMTKKYSSFLQKNNKCFGVVGDCNPTLKISRGIVPAHTIWHYMGNKIKKINPPGYLYLSNMSVVNLLTALASLQELKSAWQSSQWAFSEHWGSLFNNPTKELSLDLDAECSNNYGEKKDLKFTLLPRSWWSVSFVIHLLCKRLSI